MMYPHRPWHSMRGRSGPKYIGHLMKCSENILLSLLDVILSIIQLQAILFCSTFDLERSVLFPHFQLDEESSWFSMIKNLKKKNQSTKRST